MPRVKKMQETSPLKLRLKPIVATPKLEDLMDVFNGIASNFGITPVGEPKHAKLENAFYRVDYDEYPVENGKWKVISYGDRYSSITIRDDAGRKWLVYGSLTVYLEENLKLLRRTRASIAKDICLGSNNWPQDDEKRAYVHKPSNWNDPKEVYRLLKAYIGERLKTS